MQFESFDRQGLGVLGYADCSRRYCRFWQCPNGKECKYKHALPPGYILKSQMKVRMLLFQLLCCLGFRIQRLVLGQGAALSKPHQIASTHPTASTP